MKKRYALASVFTGVLALAAWALPAGAQPTKFAAGGAHAVALGNVGLDPSDPTVAFVTGQYLCPNGADPHLWVSVKQLNDTRPNNALKGDGSGFSGVADTWSQTHPDPSLVTCDGAWHTITVQTNESEGVGHGALQPGQVYVQFCLTPAAENDNSWAAWDMRFAVAR